MCDCTLYAEKKVEISTQSQSQQFMFNMDQFSVSLCLFHRAIKVEVYDWDRDGR